MHWGCLMSGHSCHVGVGCQEVEHKAQRTGEVGRLVRWWVEGSLGVVRRGQQLAWWGQKVGQRGHKCSGLAWGWREHEHKDFWTFVPLVQAEQIDGPEGGAGPF